MDEKQLIGKIKRKPKDGLIDAFEMFGPLVPLLLGSGNSSPEMWKSASQIHSSNCGSPSINMMSAREA